MRPSDFWVRPGSRKALWLALAAVCLVCTLVVAFYEVEPASWGSLVDGTRPLQELQDHNIDDPHNSDSPSNFPSNSAAVNNPTTSSVPLTTPAETGEASDRRCRGAFADPGNVLLVIKTGATEIYEKLPTQLLTTLGCSENYLIFSDLDEQIGPYHIQDALANFTQSLKDTLPDFHLYLKQQDYRRTGQDIAKLKKDGHDAWTLDKYKFLHMVEMAWNERPDMDWYVFIEPDTYLVWSNMLLWLQTLSPQDELYMGSVAYVISEPFAHGGSGYVISGQLLKRFVGENPGMANRYDEVFTRECCGDFVLARTIKQEINVGVQNFWPQINGEKPATLPFGPTHWCQPVVTMHHVEPRERSTIFDFEQARENISEPLLFRELSEIAFPSDDMPTEEKDWDNLSNVQLRFPGDITPTLEQCRDSCLTMEACFQYRYNGEECHVLTDAFKRGAKREDDGKQWVSGWNVRKIQDWRDSHPCETPEWVHAH
ncbi:hypothetical protein BO70DRAFT_363527 [Aspergillus heteromorphus CBS 117.55]|uniref:Glycosyltransferase family 31 protein n=1 Tax=Aspergillus heteromorphus CBS 117.55 TaxID=1448321 RepID=A0A317VVF6_9EURO|nr:uncharacterized protein BO70DRAFT_363527 [Aspergillus heteromorphus CBS 117.55]PWY76967.1 hypothetical protein BO70DRAFT_363527 [Aspergillus heteromorphus CBS 117.55]